MRNEVWIEELPTELTPMERADRGRQLARKHVELDEHEVHAKAVKDSLKSKAAGIEAEIKSLAQAVDSGKERRPQECYESVDVRRFEVNVIRMDTGEVVRSRAMDKTEREAAIQGQLFEREPVDVKASQTARKAVADTARKAAADDSTGTTAEPVPVADAQAVDDTPAKKAEGPMAKRRRKMAADKAKADTPKRENVVDLDDDSAGTIDNPQPVPEPIPPAD